MVYDEDPKRGDAWVENLPQEVAVTIVKVQDLVEVHQKSGIHRTLTGVRNENGRWLYSRLPYIPVADGLVLVQPYMGTFVPAVKAIGVIFSHYVLIPLTSTTDLAFCERLSKAIDTVMPHTFAPAV